VFNTQYCCPYLYKSICVYYNNVVIDTLRIQHTDEPVQQQESWLYIGRYRSHSRPVTGLEFGVLEDGTLALFSVGEDRCMVQTANFIQILLCTLDTTVTSSVAL
jgi:hypothetical protein